MKKRSDRGLAIAIGAYLLIALVGLGVAVLLMHASTPETHRVGPRGGAVGGFVVATVFSGLAAVEVIRRLLNGPQPSGRHTRD